MSQRDPEYDRFGPWVLEVTEEDPMPPLFVSHITRTESPLLSVKIPRKIARRDAHPGMNLYDYVVNLYADEMLVLRRVDEDGVRESTIRYRDVQHLRVSEELLRGILHLAVPGEPYDLPYNTVSNDVIRRLVGLIRERYGSDARAATVDPLDAADLGELSFYFERLLRDEGERQTGMLPLAAQSDTPVGTLEESTWRRALFGLAGKRLLESLHLSDGRELKVIDRGRPYTYRWQSVYGRAETWIPLANVTACEWDHDPGDAGTVSLAVRTAGGASRWVFTHDNRTLGHYRDALAALSGATRR